MSVETTSTQSRPISRSIIGTGFTGFGDKAFYYVSLAFGLSVVAVILWIGVSLYLQSVPAMHKFGWTIFRNLDWDVPNEKYGILPFIYGTLFSSAIAVLIAVPISVGSALFLTEIAPRWLSTPLSFTIEMLAAVPSIIFGLFGFLVLCPLLNSGPHSIGQFLVDHFGTIPLFEGPPYLTNLLAAGVVLAIMITPIITSISRDVITTVPPALREASLGLGATRWETISNVVLKASQSGIVGAVILGLGRAIGETMAVIMVIGNTVQLPKSLLQPAYTMPGLLALQFKEAQNQPMQRSVLLEIAFALFVITFLVNGLARLLILITKQGQSAADGPVQRLKAAAGMAFKWIGIGVVVFFVARQIYGDVIGHGLKGLLGPVEAIVLMYAILRVIPILARKTPAWGFWRKAVHLTMFGILGLCAMAGSLALGWLTVYVIQRGGHAINPSLFTQPPKSPDDPTGGMLNGIVGTGLLVLIAGSLGIPVGIVGGIYLAEFPASRLIPYVRFAADVLNGVPSVVMGMFGYALFVLPYHHFSAWAGGATLAVMMVPTILRTTEEMLRLVPSSLREASLALGSTRLTMITRIVLPAASSGIVTGILLAIARIAGETAPLLFTAFGNDLVSHNPSEPISAMTLEIYNNYSYGGPAEARAWAGALVLLGIVLVFSILARVATRRKYAIK